MTADADADADATRARMVLEQRARDLARVPEPPPDAAQAIEVATFLLADERYALETRYLRRVLPLPVPTPVPGTPEPLVGVVNLHGEILAVFDVRGLLGLPRPPRSDQTRLLVLGHGGDELGLVIDAAQEVVRLRHNEVFALPGAVDGPGRGLVRGTTRDAVALLDGTALLLDDRLSVHPADEPTEPPNHELPT